MEEKKIILSIVVPIYNVEKYLCKCIDSILIQDLPKDQYEVILVDDGSPDDCGRIADDYASNNANIRVIHRENGGLSAARNVGIQAANGEYIQFVDSDDFLEPNVLVRLIDIVKRDNLDILRFNYQNVNEDYVVFEPNKESRPFADYSGSVYDGEHFLNECLGYACYAWQFIVRAALAKECLFKDNILFEDTQWTPRILRKAIRVSSTADIVYYYLSRKGSITKSESIHKQRVLVESKLSLIEDLKGQMQSCADKRWYKGMISSTVISIISIISDKLFRERQRYIKQLYSIEAFPISTYHLSRTGRRKALLINISPRFACKLISYINR